MLTTVHHKPLAQQVEENEGTRLVLSLHKGKKINKVNNIYGLR